MKENANREFYFLGKIALVISIAGAIAFYSVGESLVEYFPKCQLRSLSGLYCPGCGGTHAVMLLLRGHVIASFFAHPFVPYAAAVYICFMLNMFISRHMMVGKMRVMNILPFIYVGIGIILIQWAVKLICLLVYGYSWI